MYYSHSTYRKQGSTLEISLISVFIKKEVFGNGKFVCTRVNADDVKGSLRFAGEVLVN